MKRRTLIPMTVVSLAMLAGAGALGFQAYRIARLQRRLEQRQLASPTAALQAENQRLRSVVRTDSSDDAAVHAELLQARNEVAALEQRALSRRDNLLAQTARDEAALANNLDPTHGLVKVGSFQNRGQATPTAAFQTLVWAAMQADDTTLAKVSVLPGPVRQRAEEMIARLPEDVRSQWTPEKLMGLWVTGAITSMSAIAVTGEKWETTDQAVVSFRAPGLEKDETVKLKLSPAGWKIVMPTRAVEKLDQSLRMGDGKGL